MSLDAASGKAETWRVQVEAACMDVARLPSSMTLACAANVPATIPVEPRVNNTDEEATDVAEHANSSSLAATAATRHDSVDARPATKSKVSYITVSIHSVDQCTAQRRGQVGFMVAIVWHTNQILLSVAVVSTEQRWLQVEACAAVAPAQAAPPASASFAASDDVLRRIGKLHRAEVTALQQQLDTATAELQVVRSNADQLQTQLDCTLQERDALQDRLQDASASATAAAAEASAELQLAGARAQVWQALVEQHSSSSARPSEGAQPAGSTGEGSSKAVELVQAAVERAVQAEAALQTADQQVADLRTQCEKLQGEAASLHRTARAWQVRRALQSCDG